MSTTVSLLAPGEAYEDRLQQLDLRFSRRFNLGGVNISANADLANVTNRADVYSSNYRVRCQLACAVNEVAGGRILRLSGQLDF